MLSDDALRGADPRRKVALYAEPLERDPFSDEALRLANPHFDVFMNRDEVRRLASDANRLPPRESAYRNLLLNQRAEARNPFVARAIWTEH
ncbi:hypothetical protein [Burkholderia pseudomallei]|uniref:hypothetical protein n=1 Tax=Burkholderia pseudomallei TaxID=28450 RepID=UPI0021F77752|nr:hypothetical protein [Burkholderia pseudomallei]MCW0014733.1 hypothetical protein [Burkholderia pseudomallei]